MKRNKSVKNRRKVRKARKVYKDPFPALTAASEAGLSDGDLHRMFFREIVANGGI